MAKNLYNHPMLGHPIHRGEQLTTFLDAYAFSIDVKPTQHSPQFRRGADALWQDFVAITGDANLAVNKRIRQNDAALLAARAKLLKKRSHG